MDNEPNDSGKTLERVNLMLTRDDSVWLDELANEIRTKSGGLTFRDCSRGPGGNAGTSQGRESEHHAVVFMQDRVGSLRGRCYSGKMRRQFHTYTPEEMNREDRGNSVRR